MRLKVYEPHDVVADFNSNKDPGDGSPPVPSYVGKPETYEGPAETRAMVVHDVGAEEDKYTLDTRDSISINVSVRKSSSRMTTRSSGSVLQKLNTIQNLCNVTSLF